MPQLIALKSAGHLGTPLHSWTPTNVPQNNHCNMGLRLRLLQLNKQDRGLVTMNLWLPAPQLKVGKFLNWIEWIGAPTEAGKLDRYHATSRTWHVKFSLSELSIRQSHASEANKRHRTAATQAAWTTLLRSNQTLKGLRINTTTT